MLQFRGIGNGFQLRYTSPSGTACTGMVNISVNGSPGDYMAAYVNDAVSPGYETITGTSLPIGDEASRPSVAQQTADAIAVASAASAAMIASVNTSLSAQMRALGTTQTSLQTAAEELGVAVANISSTLLLMNNCSAVGQIAHESGVGCRPAIALCPALSAPTNGMVSSTLPAEAGLTHTFSCNDGYFLYPARSQTTCYTNGMSAAMFHGATTTDHPGGFIVAQEPGRSTRRCVLRAHPTARHVNPAVCVSAATPVISG
eukprot:m.1233060 g.1233060  ORF g.1233060 m.1233060 type:complete len:259 (+) comp24661_c2_seq38:735-1511(+)